MGARFYVNSRYVSDTCINLRQYTWEVSTFWRYLLDGGLNQTNLKCGLRSRISFLRNPWGVKGFERLSLKELSTSRLKSTIIPWENIPVLEEGPYFIVKIIYGNNALFKAVNKEKKASQDRWTWRILTTVCPYSFSLNRNIPVYTGSELWTRPTNIPTYE